MDEDGCGMDNPQEKSVRVCGYEAFIKNLLFFRQILFVVWKLSLHLRIEK